MNSEHQQPISWGAKLAVIALLVAISGAIYWYDQSIENSARRAIFYELPNATGIYTYQMVDVEAAKKFPPNVVFRLLSKEIENEITRNTDPIISRWTENYWGQLFEMMILKYGDNGVDHLLKVYRNHSGHDIRYMIVMKLIQFSGSKRIDGLFIELIDGLKDESSEFLLMNIGKIIAGSHSMRDEFDYDNRKPADVYNWLIDNIKPKIVSP